MALGELTLSTTQGVQGSPFQATINGLTTGNVEVLADGSPGFSTVNGKLRSEGLPYPVSTVVLREYEPGVGVGYRDSRIDILAATTASRLALAQSMIADGRTLVRWSTAGAVQADGSYEYRVYAEDDLGATTSALVGSATPTPTPTPGTDAVRVAVSTGYHSGSDSGIQAALAGNKTLKSRLTRSIASGATETFAWRLAEAVPANGLDILYMVSATGGAVAAAYSLDSTNGSNGTWTALTAAMAWPTNNGGAGGTALGAHYRRQRVKGPGTELPSGAWVRLAITAPTGGASLWYPALYLRPDFRANIFASIGASLEAYPVNSKEMEDAIVAADPGADPIWFNWALGGATLAHQASDAAAGLALWGDIVGAVYEGNSGGNDVTAARPIDDDSPSALTALGDAYDAYVATIAGGIPAWAKIYSIRRTFRAYSGVTPTAQAGGMLPYEQQVFGPRIAARDASLISAATGVQHCDLYIPAMRRRAAASDGTHWSLSLPTGSVYDWMRAEIIRTVYAHFRTGSWPTKSYAEMLVEAAEWSRDVDDCDEAQWALDSLPSSTLKTSLSARVTAAYPAVIDRFGSADGTNLSAHTADSGQAWAAQSGAMLINAGRVYPSNASAYKMTWTPPSAVYKAGATFYCASDTAVGYGMLLRYTDGSNRLRVGYDSANDKIELAQTGGTQLLAASVLTPIVGRKIKLMAVPPEMADSDHWEVWQGNDLGDWTKVIEDSADAITYSAASSIGLRWANSQTTTTGNQCDAVWAQPAS